MKHPMPRIQMLNGFNQGWIRFEQGDAGRVRGRVALKEVLQGLAELQSETYYSAQAVENNKRPDGTCDSRSNPHRRLRRRPRFHLIRSLRHCCGRIKQILPVLPSAYPPGLHTRRRVFVQLESRGETRAVLQDADASRISLVRPAPLF